jgi:hypothetical protein
VAPGQSSSSASVSGTSSSSGGAEGCTEDAYEPNDEATTAMALTLAGASTTIDLGSCEGAEPGQVADDWLSFTVAANSGLKVVLSEALADADIDVRLYKATDTAIPLAYSEGATNDELSETLTWTVFPTETAVLLQVINYGVSFFGQTFPIPSDYTLQIDITPNGVCEPDLQEENDTEAAAKVLPFETGEQYSRSPQTACMGDLDYYEFTVPKPGADTTIRVRFDSAEGTLATQVTESGQTTTLGTSAYADGYQTITFPSEAAKTYVLKVESTGTGPGVNYQLELARGGFCDPDEMTSNDTEGTAAAVDDEGTQGTICETEADYLKVVPGRSGSATIALYQSRGDLLDAKVFAAGGEETPIATFGSTVDPVTSSRKVTFDATENTTYYIKLSQADGYGRTLYAVVPEGLAFCEEDVNEPNDSPETATVLADLDEASMGQRMCGNTTADYFSFTVVNAPGEARVEIAHSPGAQLTSTITAGGQTVTVVTASDDNLTTLSFEATANTTYILKVEGATTDAAPAYQVTVIPPPPDHDSCDGAIALAANQTVSGTTLGATNDVEVADDCTSYGTEGGDVVYSINIPADGKLTATLTSEADLAMYLIDSCTSRCCWWGVDEGASGEEETLMYENTTGSEQTLFLVVDVYSPSADGKYSLAIDLQ